MKKIKLLLCFSFLILHFSFCFCQITFTQIPMDSELVARDPSTNLGTVNIAGVVKKALTPYDSIDLKIYRDSKLINSICRKLSYSAGSAPFTFTFQIPAELHEYKVSVLGIKNSVQTIDTTINALVAGDAYIIDGQSNALAPARDGQNADINKSEFIRVFGNSDSSTAGLMANLKWFRGEGNGFFLENGHAGQWGLRLARLIADTMRIPVAIFNSACGGTPITEFEPPDNYSTDSNSNYGRLYYRLVHSGLQHNVRAIFWSQGETDADGATSTADYIDEFNTLEHGFTQDFRGFKKIYIFQTKTDTIYPPENLMQIEEAQRELAAASNGGIEIIPTAALKSDRGGLHFAYEGGYEIFANRLYRLISRDLYGITPPGEIDAPMITAAYLADTATLVITENADLLEQRNPAMLLQGYDVDNNTGAAIDSVFTDKNKIILQLSQYPGLNATVSYSALPAYNASNWLTNTGGLEPLCFYKYPLADSMNTITSGLAYNRALSLIAYPNPFHNATTLLVNTGGNYEMEVNDLAGREMQCRQFTGNRCQLSAEGLAPGMYFVLVFNTWNNLVGTTKVVVQ
jgi:hypothetical protein